MFLFNLILQEYFDEEVGVPLGANEFTRVVPSTNFAAACTTYARAG